MPNDGLPIITQRRDVVQGLFPRDGISVVWGAPKCSKSFWMLDVSLHVALGREYRGRKVQQGPVLLCAFEGQRGTQTRIEAWRQNFMAEDHAADEVGFYLMPLTLNLVAECTDLIAATKQATPKPPALIMAAVAVIYALVVPPIFYKEPALRDLPAIFADSARLSGVIGLIIGFVGAFGWVLTYSKFPFHVAEAIAGIAPQWCCSSSS